MLSRLLVSRVPDGLAQVIIVAGWCVDGPRLQFDDFASFLSHFFLCVITFPDMAVGCCKLHRIVLDRVHKANLRVRHQCSRCQF